MNKPRDASDAFQNAWNSHNIKALGALFVQDATFMNRFGHYVKGVEEIIAMHAPIHETIYRDSTLKNEVIDIVPIAEGASVVHFWSRLPAGQSSRICSKRPAR